MSARTKAAIGISMNPEITVHYRDEGGSKRRVVKRHEGISGTSLDVTLWLREFGMLPHLIATTGSNGFFSESIARFLEESGLPVCLLPIRHQNSLAFIVIDEVTGETQHFSHRAPFDLALRGEAIAKLKGYVAPLLPSFLIGTGVTPDDVFLVKTLLDEGPETATRILNPRASLLHANHRAAFSTLLGRTDVLVLNHEELGCIAPEATLRQLTGVAEGASLLHQMGVGIVIVTCAEQGAYLFERGEEPYHQETTEVGTLVDATGAGDAFLSGMVVARDWGWTYREAMPFASLLAGFALTESGGAVVKPFDVVLAKWRELYPEGKEFRHVA